MKNELKQELTRRLCECNNGGLVLVMYDIYFGFSEDVKAALASNDRAALKKAVADVEAALDELIGALDFKYPLAGQLYPLYSYCKRLFSTVLYSHRLWKLFPLCLALWQTRGFLLPVLRANLL